MDDACFGGAVREVTERAAVEAADGACGDDLRTGAEVSLRSVGRGVVRLLLRGVAERRRL